ncbi:MAG: hypothetical protein D8M52_09115 [Chlorobi bacterium]|nr:MAG: hypothetical protein F9K28_08250 [Bacteroidota bacterium]KXK33839.1 MAG: hypothetical protein UZ06_CHB003001562 [Chlorobi bacterium OLB6]MBE2266037.1 hypothetical protein [Flavobacteriales bacterium]MBL1161862.1 hypothetical protein [Chlorobiota bacterium]MBW7854349.1 hypothetical protein [Candidatus Kapabacteria bacterium]MCC6330680.1 hypothetical protein [Ignavibacteria bacterium]
MQRFFYTLAASVLLCLVTATTVMAQGPRRKSFGIGIVLGDPLGLTAKYWLNREESIAASLGTSYFGWPRVQVDYLQQINTFRSRVTTTYIGGGVGVGLGSGHDWYIAGDDSTAWYKREQSKTGIAVRFVAGINVIPRRSHFEYYVEVAPNLGLLSGFGLALDAGLGVRYYL